MPQNLINNTQNTETQPQQWRLKNELQEQQRHSEGKKFEVFFTKFL